MALIRAQAQQNPLYGCWFSDVRWTMQARLLTGSIRVVDELANGDHARMAHRGAGAGDGRNTAIIRAAGTLGFFRAAVVVLVAVMIGIGHRGAVVGLVSGVTIFDVRNLDGAFGLGGAFGMHRSADGRKAVAGQ